jgi:hypothetical protein
MNPDQNHLKDLDRCADIKYQNISGRQHPKADSVINRAHRDATDRGLFIVGSTTRVEQVPHESNGNMAVVWVQATFRSVVEQGEFVFEGVADADPSNTTAGSTANALVRMAHTRALGRALSLALNIDEAMAEEIAENGGAPTQQSSGGSAPAGNSTAGGGNIPSWKFTIPMGRNKDKRIDDPTVDVSDLQWFIDNNKLNMKNPQTQQYDLPDQQRIDLFKNEIAKRSGQAPSTSAPAQQSSPPPNNSTPAGNGNWKPSPANIATIVGLGNQQQKNYAALKDMCLSNFGKPDPTALTQDEFTALSIMLGGEPV